MSETLSEPMLNHPKTIARSETALELERESRASPDSLKSLNSLDFDSPIDFKFKVSILFPFFKQHEKVKLWRWNVSYQSNTPYHYRVLIN